MAGGVGVVVHGSSSGNIIENNLIHDFTGNQVCVTNAPSGTIVRGNTMHSNFIGFVPPNLPGGWAGESSYLTQHLEYDINKLLLGSGSSPTGGVIDFSGTNTEISGNTFYNIMGSASFFSSINPKFIGNTGHNSSSVGGNYFENINGQIEFGNNLLYDINIVFRGNFMENLLSTSNIYIYGNRVYSTNRHGATVYWSQSGAGSTPARIYIYHNTSVHMDRGFSDWGDYSFGSTSGQLFPNMLAVNNLVQVYSGSEPPYSDDTSGAMCASPTGMARWDYNWTFGTEFGCAWVGTNNFLSSSKGITDTVLPDPMTGWIPPMSARVIGIDIAHNFTVNGVNYTPLPGFSPGYFGTVNLKPDAGAVQTGS